MKFKYLIDIESRDLERVLNNFDKGDIISVEKMNRTTVEDLT